MSCASCSGHTYRAGDVIRLTVPSNRCVVVRDRPDGFELVGPPTRRRTGRLRGRLWRDPTAQPNLRTRSTPRSPQRTARHATVFNPTGTFRSTATSSSTHRSRYQGAGQLVDHHSRQFRGSRLAASGRVDPHRCRLLWQIRPRRRQRQRTHVRLRDRGRRSRAKSTATRSTALERAQRFHHRRPVHPPHKSWSVARRTDEQPTVANLIGRTRCRRAQLLLRRHQLAM